jgi:hypothetical protein
VSVSAVQLALRDNPLTDEAVVDQHHVTHHVTADESKQPLGGEVRASDNECEFDATVHRKKFKFGRIKQLLRCAGRCADVGHTGRLDAQLLDRRLVDHGFRGAGIEEHPTSHGTACLRAGECEHFKDPNG